MPELPAIDLSGNKKIFLLLGGAVLLIIIIAVFVLRTLFGNLAPVTLTYWGIWEPESVYQSVISDYQRFHPNITVKYQKQSSIQYRDRLTTSTSQAPSPDIITIHNTWLPMFVNSLQPIPADVTTLGKFKQDYYPVANSDLVAGGQLYALPLEIDDLGLYVNQDIFTAANLSYPSVWQGTDGFDTVASKLTVRDGSGRIQTAGAALGTASNVDHWQDILSLMMLQAGVDMNTASNSQQAVDTLGFYTSFMNTSKTWDETQDQSTLAFAEGKLAMYLGPSWRYFNFEEFKKTSNPNLNFKVLPVPQLTGGKTINFATYWAIAVPKKSAHQKEAFDFLKFLSTPAELQKLYTAASAIRAFGEPYPHPSMAASLLSDPKVGPFISEAPTAQSAYLVSATWDGDTGLNSKIAKYYSDAINSSLRNGNAKSALDTVAKGVNQVLSEYGLVSRSPVTP